MSAAFTYGGETTQTAHGHHLALSFPDFLPTMVKAVPSSRFTGVLCFQRALRDQYVSFIARHFYVSGEVEHRKVRQVRKMHQRDSDCVSPHRHFQLSHVPKCGYLNTVRIVRVFVQSP